jgi:hypothetical protein
MQEFRLFPRRILFCYDLRKGSGASFRKGYRRQDAVFRHWKDGGEVLGGNTESFPFVSLDEFIVMPNHIHGIIIIYKGVGTQNFAFPLTPSDYQSRFKSQARSLSSIIRGFKIGVIKFINENSLEFHW